ncbi:MAG: SIR2 family protein [Bacillota bacterium]
MTEIIDDLSLLNDQSFSDAISELENLMSQSDRAFLLGAGCSRCAGLPLTIELTEEVIKSLKDGSTNRTLLQSVIDCFAGADQVTIEDYMSELIDLLAIAKRRKQCGVSQATINLVGKTYELTDLENALDEIKQRISDCIDKPVSIDMHKRFVTAIHRTLRTGKAKIKAVDYFILNYDTLIEDALALERLSYVDGFNGGATGWWDAGSFENDEVVARVLKIHGSLDWCLLEDDTLPRRIRSGKALSTIFPREKVLIWPAATKYQETQLNPYAQVLEVMRRSLRPYVGSEVVLTICGYRFGDSHVNIELEKALHESDGRLTYLIFTELDEPAGVIKEWLETPEIKDQVRIYAKRGFFHGKKAIASSVDLPWWKFETLVRLLGGER